MCVSHENQQANDFILNISHFFSIELMTLDREVVSLLISIVSPDKFQYYRCTIEQNRTKGISTLKGPKKKSRPAKQPK